jgi:hypothetical protein
MGNLVGHAGYFHQNFWNHWAGFFQGRNRDHPPALVAGDGRWKFPAGPGLGHFTMEIILFN